MRILIVDDSETEVAMLKHLFEMQPDMSVAGIARNGHEAIRLAESLKPDIITMDIMMPDIDGVEATNAIMHKVPAPIVVISSGVGDPAMNITFRALEAG